MADPLVSQVLKGDFLNLIGEEVMLDSLRDIVKDEVKRRMRQELEANPELMEELREAVRAYFEAKVQQAYASLKVAKASAKLGVHLLPPDLRDELARDVARMVEKELTAVLDKAL